MNKFETIACPVCSETNFKIIYKSQFPNDFSHKFLTQIYRSSSDQKLFEQVVQCNKCGMVYLNPRLLSNLIIDSYSEGEDKIFVDQNILRINTFRKNLKFLNIKYNMQFSSKTRILDIGCAGGAFIYAAKRLGLSAIGIEPNKWLSEYARTKYDLDVRTGTLLDHYFSESSFDIITLWDVIEHLPNPQRDLAEIRRILKQDGFLIVNYPDFGSFFAKILGRKWPFLLSVHLAYYTRETIQKQLEKNGFKILGMKLYWQTLELGYILKRISAYFSFACFLENFVKKIGLNHLPIKYWMGQTRVVAKKC